jgi:hypothetical protein
VTTHRISPRAGGHVLATGGPEPQSMSVHITRASTQHLTETQGVPNYDGLRRKATGGATAR